MVNRLITYAKVENKKGQKSNMITNRPKKMDTLYKKTRSKIININTHE